MGVMNRFFKQMQRYNFERGHIVHSDSLLAPAAKHQHYFAPFAVLNTMKRPQGSTGIAPHPTVLGNLDLVGTTERRIAFMFWDISNLNRCESISRFLKIQTTQLRKSPAPTTEEEVDHRNARIISVGKQQKCFAMMFNCIAVSSAYLICMTTFEQKTYKKSAQLKMYRLPLIVKESDISASYTYSLG